MQSRPFSYLFTISYFGARYKGWAPQPNQPTIQRKLERVLRHILGHDDFSLIGASRTDSGVSCLGGFFQIFLREKTDMEAFLPELNENLPSDIRLGMVQAVDINFNLIQEVERKTYRYYFCNSDKFNPLASAYIEHVQEKLDFESMKEAAETFIGQHNFKAFCKASPNKTSYLREVLSAKVESSHEFFAAFFPEQVYYFEVSGSGFLHHQVRKMMTAIWNVGKKEWTLIELSERLENPEKEWSNLPPAPSNGLILWETKLKIH